jgi:hypothetical protein
MTAIRIPCNHPALMGNETRVDMQMHFNPGLDAYIEREGFAVCESLAAQGTRVDVMRVGCS